jgi:hypothetical protein
MADLILPPGLRPKQAAHQERQELLDRAREVAKKWNGFIRWAEAEGVSPEDLKRIYFDATEKPAITGQEP